ncbi:tetratricopeptide repeat protein [Lentzea sp. NPDC004782]|uniref:tetratricopeptide repeat protein n=1 Tax=Lentzea sp. NPDC004782 TaxID=3154458 RepID=UPI0033B87961
MTHNVVSGTASGVVMQAGTITGDVHLHAPPGGHSVVPRQLPPVPRGFTGREDVLAALDAAVNDVAGARPGTAPLVVVSGMGGVGKTTVAVCWAHRVMGDFPDGQLYVDLSGYGVGAPVAPGEALGAFLRALGAPAETVPAEVAERTAMFRSMVSGRRMLLLLDNARSEDQVRPLLPGTGSCAVVITSRANLTGLVVDHGAEQLRLDVFSEQEALEALHTLIGPRLRTEQEAAVDLARRCAYLPLALRIASGLVLNAPDASVAELVEELSDEHARLDVLDTGDDPRTAVRSVFSWSYRQLPADAARLFRLLGLVPGREFDRRAVAALLDVPVTAASRTIGVLARARLVRERSQGRVEMHDLLRVYAAELVRQEDDEEERGPATKRYFDHHLHTADLADRLLTPHRFRVDLQGEPRHTHNFGTRDEALAWLNAGRDTFLGLLRADDHELDARRWQLAYTLRGYFFLTKDWDAWVGTHELALTATQRLGDRRAEALTHNNLGMALLERGDGTGAESHYVRARELFEEIGDVRGVSNALGNEAWVLYHRGDHAGALDVAARALANYRQLQAHVNVGITLRGMAIFAAALGRFAESREHLAEAMELFTRTGADLDVVMALNCLGEVHEQAGEPQHSAHAHRQAAALAEGLGSTFELARAHAGLGRAALAVGDIVLARQEMLRARDLYTRLGAPEAEEADRFVALIRGDTE